MASPVHRYSFRTMAQDQVDVMTALGFDRFFVAGHDRGRAAPSHGARSSRACARSPLLDIVPTVVWTTRRTIGRASWHWSFMAQPEDMFERMIAAIPAREFVVRHLGRTGRRHFSTNGPQRVNPMLHRRRRFTVRVRTIAPPPPSIWSTITRITRLAAKSAGRHWRCGGAGAESADSMAAISCRYGARPRPMSREGRSRPATISPKKIPGRSLTRLSVSSCRSRWSPYH